MKKLLAKLVENKLSALLLILSAAVMSYFISLDTIFAAVPDVSEFVRDIGEDGELYNPIDEGLHRRALEEGIASEGISMIQTIIFQIIDFAKYILGAGAVLMMTILGVKLVVTGSAEEKLTEAKRHLIYVIVGFLIVMIADYAVANVFFGVEGEILQNEETAKFFARQGSLELQRIYSGIEFLVGAIAVLVIVINGFLMVTSAGEEIDNRKKAIMWGVVGLVLIGLSELIVKDILFAEQGSTISIPKAIDLIVMITNFITGFAAFISVALIIYAGVQFILAFITEGSDDKGKKALIAAIIGLLIVAGSYAITATIISFSG
jgi:hypothetical protein